MKDQGGGHFMNSGLQLHPPTRAFRGEEVTRRGGGGGRMSQMPTAFAAINPCGR